MRAPAILLACAALLACEKGEAPKGSGPLSADDVALFEQLPAGGNVVMGGNYMKLQSWMQSGLAPAMAAMGPGWKEWTTCWAELPNLKAAGTANITGAGGEMRMVFTGATLADMQKCADKAGFKATLDSDGKFLATEIEVLGQPAGQGMLKLPSGALYTRQSFGLGGAVVPATRAELEADIAKLAQGTALDDDKLQKLVAKVDRTKTMWFAGTAAGTPIGDKLGEVYGAVDIVPGMSIDVTIELLDRDLADKLVEGVQQAKKQAAQLPAEMRSLVEGLVVKRDGARIRFMMKASDEQLASLMKQMSMFAGAGYQAQ